MSASACIIASGICFFFVNSCVKFLSGIPAHELTFFRSIISVTMTYAAIRAAGLNPLGKNKPMLFVRGLAGTSGQLLYYITLQSMPIATAVTIQYLYPILTVIFGGFLLKERPNALQWLFILVSFAGVWMVKGFDPRVTAAGIGIGVLSALLIAYAYTLVRALRHQDHALIVMFYLPFVGVLVVGPYTLTHWTQPHGWDWLVILVIGSMTQIGQYFMTLGYQKEKAANTANLNYLTIAYALITGLVFFGEPIKPLALVGIAIIVASSYLGNKFKTPEPVKPAPTGAPVPAPVR